MATTIINPPPSTDASSNGLGFLLGIIALIVFGFLFFIYILPIIQQGITGRNGVQINVPKSIDVKVQQTK